MVTDLNKVKQKTSNPNTIYNYIHRQRIINSLNINLYDQGQGQTTDRANAPKKKTLNRLEDRAKKYQSQYPEGRHQKKGNEN